MQPLKPLSWPSAATQFFILTGQLGLLLLVLRQFQIESNAFIRIAVLAFSGFVIHYFLPMRLRLPFFALLSLVGVSIVLGLSSAAWLVVLGMALIGICHLPLRLKARVILLLLTMGLLAFLRVDWLPAPWSPAIWPILGSMFMFRLIVYLYDLTHDTAAFSLSRTMSYFFMLPNVCFPLFPVVDYKTFRRNYYDADSYSIYQTGIQWMTRGVVHLILYRVVYYYLTMAPAEVAEPGDLVRFSVTTFLLYLRISGQFHMIVGMLHLFGFRLPETHHRYYLASSFTDFWRRINIYWKDFMMKLFYYPLYFRLRGWGTTTALVLSTLFVFFVTWLLHAYQWFWLRGSVLWAGPDVTFWTVLAVFVVINSLYEIKHGRTRTLSRHSLGFRGFTVRALSTLGTFSVICALWSLWNSESLTEWISLWEVLPQINASNVAMVLALLLAAVVVGGGVSVIPVVQSKGSKVSSFFRAPAFNFAFLLFLAAIGIQDIYVQMGPTAASAINSLRSGRLSRLDVAEMEKGYYEDLSRVERFNSQLWELYMKRPRTWLDVRGTGLERFTGDFLQSELVPSFIENTGYGSVHTNRWGMRDRDYEQIPAPNTYRIAMLGASSVMGWGVGDDEKFESLLERRLNSDRAGKPYTSYEILNFAVPGYQPLQQVVVLEKALSFQPRALFYVAAGREASSSASYLAEAASKDIPIPYEYLKDVLRRADVAPKTAEATATRRLRPFRNEILSWTYKTMVVRCSEHQVLPVLVFLPQVAQDQWEEETSDILRIAREAGFTVLDLGDVYKGHDHASIRVADWDNHPNAQGHSLIAERLYDLLSEKADKFFDLHLAQL